MAEKNIPLRQDVPADYTWNAPSVFPSVEAWTAELARLGEDLGALARFPGHLGESAARLADYFDTFLDLYERVGKVYVFASMDAAADTGDQNAAAMSGQAMGVYTRLLTANAFANPEILQIGYETLRRWMAEEPRLAPLAHYFEDLYRQQAHVRSAEVEEVLGLAADPLGSVSRTASVLANADLQFRPAISSSGESFPVTQSTFMQLVLHRDREVRRTTWESYRDGYLAFKNTLANNLAVGLKADVFMARARRHHSSLEAALFPYNIPPAVFHNLIATFRENLPTWHRYWARRRKALGVSDLHPYDVWSPLAESAPDIPFEQAVDWICEGLRPMGEEYIAVMRRGCLQDRWVDRYPNIGKRSGAFSSGVKGTHPFIMMHYNGSLNSVSTLAHELGHSMHSWQTWQTQPAVYSDYSLFIAEVASNFHQTMVRAHLLKSNPDPAFQIAVIEEAMYNFHRYFFQMPTLARWELEMHERLERGEGLTADLMNGRMADLFGEGYGSEMVVDRDRVGITWAEFGHLYANFYVFQYATGISAAHALAAGVLDGKPDAVENYLSFLRAGSSLYPLDALKLAGVDMTQPDAVRATFQIMSDYVDRLEVLLGIRE